MPPLLGVIVRFDGDTLSNRDIMVEAASTLSGLGPSIFRGILPGVCGNNVHEEEMMVRWEILDKFCGVV